MKQHRPFNAMVSQGIPTISRWVALPTAALVGAIAPFTALTPVAVSTLSSANDVAIAAPAPATEAQPDPSESVPGFRIKPVEGKIRVKVTNGTRIPIAYGLLGDNPVQIMNKGTVASLEELPIPVTITFYPQGKEFVVIQPRVSSEPGVLEVTLVETKDLNANRHALVVNDSGLFFTQ